MTDGCGADCTDVARDFFFSSNPFNNQIDLTLKRASNRETLEIGADIFFQAQNLSQFLKLFSLEPKGKIR